MIDAILTLEQMETGVMFYHRADERAFFEWLQRIPCVATPPNPTAASQPLEPFPAKKPVASTGRSAVAHFRSFNIALCFPDCRRSQPW